MSTGTYCCEVVHTLATDSQNFGATLQEASQRAGGNLLSLDQKLPKWVLCGQNQHKIWHLLFDVLGLGFYFGAEAVNLLR